MAYQYQTFGSGQVFTSAQAQQVEDNIRDHRHGVDGVGASGASWPTTSKASAFSLLSTDAATLFKCWGDFAITCPTAATLGTQFGAAFVNAGSGRVVLNAASGQWIAGNSCYALTPGEGVIMTSDGIELDVVGGRDRACLARYTQTVSSLGFVPLTTLFPGDFTRYVLYVQPNTQTGGLIQMQVSMDSGSNYMSTNYQNTTGAQTNCVNLTFFNTTSRDCRWATVEFTNGEAVQSASMHFNTMAIRANNAQDLGIGRITSAGVINALRLLRDAGFYQAGTRMELWAEGRVRR